MTRRMTMNMKMMTKTMVDSKKRKRKEAMPREADGDIISMIDNITGEPLHLPLTRGVGL